MPENGTVQELILAFDVYNCEIAHYLLHYFFHFYVTDNWLSEIVMDLLADFGFGNLTEK